MRAGELFAGIGGFGLGLERAGLEVAWQVEIDAKATAVLERRFPGVERHADVREVGVERLAAVDLVAGGFPCQDLSVAGGRAGLGGERSGLWWEFHRILSELRPRWCVVENVPGLLSATCPDVDGRPVTGGSCAGGCMRAHGGAIGLLLGSLAELGYGFAYRVLDARFFGLAQRRRRVLVVGCLGDGRRAAQVLLEPEGLCGDLAARGPAREDVAGTLGSQPAGGGWRADLDRSGAFVTALDLRNTGSGGNIGWRDGSVGSVTLDTSGNVMDPNGETFVLAYDERNVTSAENRSNPQPGAPCHTLNGDAPLLAATLTAGGNPNSNAPGRHHGDDENLVTFRHRASATQTMRTDPRVTDPLTPSSMPAVAYQCQGSNVGEMGALRRGNGNVTGGVPFVGVRRLTPVECERLQGFPDGWTEGQSDAARYRQLGNALPPPFSEWIGRRIIQAEATK